MKSNIKINKPPLFIAILNENIEMIKLLLTRQDLNTNEKLIV